MLRGSIAIVAVGLVGFGVSGQKAQDLNGVAAKIILSRDKSALSVGQPVMVRVELADPGNHAARANKDVRVELETKFEDGAIEKKSVTITRGETGTLIKLQIKNSGLVEIRASSPQLADGGTIFTIPKSPPQDQPPPPPAPSEEQPVATITPNETPRNLATRGITATPSDRGRSPASIESLRSARELRVPLNVQPTLSSGSVQPPTWKPPIKLQYYPKRPLRADDGDPATVVASLPSDNPAHPDISVYLLSDVGPLTPQPLKIPSGEFDASAKLVATTPGSVSVWYWYSSPPGTATDPPLSINFMHPVWAPRLVPRQPKITLLDSMDIAVEFVNREGVNVPADKDRPVSISINAGSGELSPEQVTIAANAPSATTKFTPTRAGKVKLLATSPYLAEQPAEFEVVVPLGLLALCGLGSVAGALVAYWTEKREAPWQRIAVGFVTGYVLYCGLIFGILVAPRISHTYLLNPIAAVLIAIIGGFAGTKVFKPIFKQFGL